MCPPSCAEEVCNHDNTEQVSASHSTLEEQDSEQSWHVALKGHLDCGLFCMFLWSGLKDCKVQVCRWPSLWISGLAAAGPTVICVVMPADVGTQSITVSLLRPFLLWGRCSCVVIRRGLSRFRVPSEPCRQETFPTANTPVSPHISRQGTYSDTT